MYKQQSALRASCSSHTEATGPTGPLAGAWRHPQGSHRQPGPGGSLVGPPWPWPGSLQQTHCQEPSNTQTPARKLHQGEEHRERDRGAPRAPKASQQQHGHHPGTTQPPPSPQTPARHTAKAQPLVFLQLLPALLCATSTFIALFLFLNLAFCTRTAVTPTCTDLPHGPQRQSRWCETRHWSAHPHPRTSPFAFQMKPPTSAPWSPTLKPGARILLSSYPSWTGGCSGPLAGPSQRWGSARPGDLLSQDHHNEQQRYPRSPVRHRQGHGLATATRTET